MNGSDMVRVAVVGLGRAGILHLKTLARLPRLAKVVAVCDIQGGKQRQSLLSAELPFFQDFGRMLQEVCPQAVILTTPPSSRADLIEAAALRNVPIFCEKPLALNLDEAARICRAVQEAKVIFQIGFQRRFDDLYRQAFLRLQRNEIGAPLTFKATARDSWRPPVEFASPDVSGGLLLDMGIHDFDLARWLMSSEVTRVSCEASRLLYPELEAARDYDNAVVNLRFQSGALGTVEVSRTGTFGYDVRIEVVGTQGALFLGPAHQQDLLQATSSGLTFQASAGFEIRFQKAFEREMVEFLGCVREGRRPECGLQDGVRALEIALAARRSAWEEGRPVTVSG